MDEINDPKKVILTEIRNILCLENNLEKDCISLYNLDLFYKNKYKKFEIMEELNKNKFASKFYSTCDWGLDLDGLNFNYDIDVICQFEKEASHNIEIINSNFLTNIDHYGVRIFIEINCLSFFSNFCLLSHSYDYEYSCRCNLSEVMNIVKECTDEIFKKAFVKIENCPELCRKDLYDIREKQLYKIRRKQKKKELINKIFPFIEK